MYIFTHHSVEYENGAMIPGATSVRLKRHQRQLIFRHRKGATGCAFVGAEDPFTERTNALMVVR